MSKENGNSGGEATILVEEDARPTTEPQMTLAEAKNEGLDPIEIEAGKKHGLIVDEDKSKKKKEEESDVKKTEAEAAAKEKKEVAEKERRTEDRKGESRPWDLTKEEREQMKERTPNEIALYVKSKKDKHKRQEAEANAAQLKAQVQFYKGKAEALEKVATAQPKKEEQANDDADDFLGDYGTDPLKKKEGEDKNKPLTEADLDRREKEKEAATKKQQEQFEARKTEVVQKLNEQEIDFKEDHPDYTEVYDKFTLDILKLDDKKLTEMFPKRHEREGVKTLVAKMLEAVKNPEQFTGDESATAYAYEIGKLHPEYGQSASAGEDDDDDTGEQGDKGSDDDVDENPLEKRLDKQGRPSSAPLSGGANRRPKSVRDLTGEDLATMSDKQFKFLWKNHRSDVERILAS